VVDAAKINVATATIVIFMRSPLGKASIQP
jgi:hypothetical protein